MKQRILNNSRPVKQSFAFVVGTFLNTTSITNKEPDNTTDEISPRVPNRANSSLVWSMIDISNSLYKMHTFYKNLLLLSRNITTKTFFIFIENSLLKGIDKV